MCGIWRAPWRPDLDPATLDRVLSGQDIARTLRYVNVTGGEPTEHPKLTEIVETLNRRCPSLLEVSVGTNGLNSGSCLSALRGVRAALDRRISVVLIFSLDGIGEHHDRVRGTRGAFCALIESLDACRGACDRLENVSLRLNTTFSNDNLKGIGSVVSFAKRMDLPITLTWACVNSLYLRNSDASVASPPAQSVSQIGVVEAVGELSGERYLSYTNRHYLRMIRAMLQGSARRSSCVFQTNGLFVDLDWTVYPCGTAADVPYGNLMEKPFSELFLGERGDRVRLRLKETYCEGCMSNSYYGIAGDVLLGALHMHRYDRIGQ